MAARKAAELLRCGALVTVIAPEVCAAMAELTSLTIARRHYAAGDAAGYRLVLTATGIPDVDGAVFADAQAAGVWVNSADDVAHCTFILPSVHRDGPVSVAVSTGGTSPALARWLRARLAESTGPGADSTTPAGAPRRWTGSPSSTAPFPRWSGPANAKRPALSWRRPPG